MLAGGCFWGVQAVFQHVEGRERAVSGYAGGTERTRAYEQVSTGMTGHAESVEVTFDPQVVSYGTILQIYFSVAHNPTELNCQGPDSGTQYRSEIFAATTSRSESPKPISPSSTPRKAFRAPIAPGRDAARLLPAEGYHQNYATLNPAQPYIAYNDAPKVEALKRLFPDALSRQAEVAGGAVARERISR